jgi:fructokinase
MTLFNNEDEATVQVAGEALIDLLMQADGRLLPRLGGSPYNLARAMAHLGRPVAYRMPLSSDAFGRQLAKALLDSGVALQGPTSACPTSLALVRVSPDGHPAYSFYRAGVADRDLDPASLSIPATARLFHVGSLSLIPPDGLAWAGLLERLAAQGIPTSVDVNMRPGVAPDRQAYVDSVRRAMQQARYLKVSDEDLQVLGFAGDPREVAVSLLGRVTQVVVLTLGREGAWAYAYGGIAIRQEAPRVTVVDAVGAGDCFYAGFLARLDELGCLQGRPAADELTEALRFGAAVTAINLQRAGCQPPWRHEVN